MDGPETKGRHRRGVAPTGMRPTAMPGTGLPPTGMPYMGTPTNTGASETPGATDTGTGIRLHLEGVSKIYGRRKVALEDVNLTWGPGVLGLLGPNGAGKSTLLGILATLVEPSRGRVTIGPWTLPRDQHAVRQRLGYLPQEGGWFPQLTVYETLDFAAIFKGIERPSARRREIERRLEQLGLQDARHVRAGRLSGGMRRRLGIAMALLGDPLLILLDEPTAGLDPEERVRFRQLLGGLGRDRLVIFSTHVVEDIAATCEEVAVIAGGRLRWLGPPPDLAACAAGLVWEVVGRAPEGAVVVSSRREGGATLLRVLAWHEPPGARPAQPSVEDGYVALLRGLAAGRSGRRDLPVSTPHVPDDVSDRGSGRTSDPRSGGEGPGR